MELLLILLHTANMVYGPVGYDVLCFILGSPLLSGVGELKWGTVMGT